MADSSPVGRQLQFVRELDRLKHVLRQTSLIDGSRRENSAEHSWHIAAMAVVLAEHAAEPFDLGRALQLLLLHDVVEIDAGDTFCYDADGNLDKAERERRAAQRIFGLLPPPQGDELLALWEEFEAGASPEARFANAMDRLEPLLQNHANGGGTWRLHGITRAQVLARMAPIKTGAPGLWPYVTALIDEACRAGNIAPDDEPRADAAAGHAAVTGGAR
jgi:putative hydrolase of HD superfamily